MNKKTLVMAAVAGMALGAAETGAVTPKAGEVKCYGVNGCTAEAKCAVSKEDLGAIKKLIGEGEYNAKWSKSEAHGCSGKGQCGAGAQIMNWVPSKPAECKERSGFIISDAKGQKIAKKA